MDALTVQIIDEAVADAATELLNQASRSKHFDHSLKDAMVKMTGDLTRCQMADYAHPAIAIAYLVHYQIPRTGLAAYLLQKAAQQRHGNPLILTKDKPLHVIDFGCGTLAVQLGLAVTLAEAIKAGIQQPAVRITSIDRARSMLNSGQTLWNHLSERARRTRQLTALYQAMQSIRANTTSLNIVSSAATEETWLTTLHTVHNNDSQHQQRVTAEMKSIADATSPRMGIIAFHWSATQIATARESWPFTAPDKPSYIDGKTPLWRFEGIIQSRAKQEAKNAGMYDQARGGYPHRYPGLGSNCGFFISEA